MDSARPTVFGELFTLKQTAEILAVSVDTLIEWNDNNILKPTITQNGDVVYKKEQIEKFLEIQKLIQNPAQESGLIIESGRQSDPTLKINSPVNEKLYRTNINQIDATTKTKNASDLHKKSYPIVFLSSLSVIAVFSAAVFFVQQDKSNSQQNPNLSILQKEAVKLDVRPNQQINHLDISETTASTTNLPTGNVETTNNKPSALSYILQDNSTAPETDNDKQISIVPQPKINDGMDISADPNNNGTNMNINVMNSPASRSNSNGTNLHMPTNLLAADSGITDIIPTNNPTGYSVLPIALLGFFSLGLLTLYKVTRKQFAYSLLSTSINGTISPGLTDNPQEQKVIEVDQKTDGTVILSFQGEEHKISKPELGSESDQFIERLLKHTLNNAKEINYDVSEDDLIKLNAPLSKLVTRLGFVGIKRDLFFPRTSKGSVFFRKYLTENDLVSMNLTADQILSELKN